MRTLCGGEAAVRGFEAPSVPHHIPDLIVTKYDAMLSSIRCAALQCICTCTEEPPIPPAKAVIRCPKRLFALCKIVVEDILHRVVGVIFGLVGYDLR